MRLMARPVTAPAAKNHRPRTPGPSRPGAPLRPPPGAAPDWQPGTADSGAFSGPAGRRVGCPARRHRRASRTGRWQGHRQPRQVIAWSVRWRSETSPESSGDLPGHFVEAADAGGLTFGLAAPDGDSVAASRHAISAVRHARSPRQAGRRGAYRKIVLLSRDHPIAWSPAARHTAG
jgi:hypothetical protein